MTKHGRLRLEDSPALVKGILTSAILAVCLTLLFGAFSLYGVISLAAARFVLFLTWAVAVGGVLLSDVIWQRPRKFKIISTIVAALVFSGIACGVDVWAMHAKERHLTKGQWNGLTKIRDNLPGACGLLVYIPAESPEAQNYGKEIQSALVAHGAKANLIFAGAFEPPVGIVVGVRSELDVCGQVGEFIAIEMTHDLKMPARIQEGFPYAAETVIVIFVGIKPPYD